jgi:hypothetical protein
MPVMRVEQGEIDRHRLRRSRDESERKSDPCLIKVVEV